MKVIVTIPAYNEEKTLGPVLKDIKSVMDKESQKERFDYQMLVIDDGSGDKTAEVAKQTGASVVQHQRNRGLAETFRTEMTNCLKLGADVIVHTDADGQYRASEIPGLLKKIKEGYDFVLASRFMGQIEEMPWLKRFGNRAFSRVISNITGLSISDGQTGFRAFTKEVAEKITITSNHTYTQEQIIRAARLKFRMIEIPAYFAKRGGNTKSRLMKNPFDYAMKAGLNLLRVYRDYEPLRFFGRIGALFLGAGIVLGGYLIYLYITNGAIGRVPSLMLSVLLMSIGLQIILFGFLADIFRK